MRIILLVLFMMGDLVATTQVPVDIKAFKKNGATVLVHQNSLTVGWPAGKEGPGKITLSLDTAMPLITSIALGKAGASTEIMRQLDPLFILRVGKRTLSPESGGWDVFFDKVPARPFTTEKVVLNKRSATVSTSGAHTIIRIDEMQAAAFSGYLEITLYNGSPLFNIAAVMSTNNDSTAILYDAGLVCKKNSWQQVAWAGVNDTLQVEAVSQSDESKNLEVKYRTVIGENKTGSLAVFPAPHQYFYPLDEAFNLKFTWCGKNYLHLTPDYGIGIRQEPEGDKRYVPWFNAPPGTLQRLNFFCLATTGKAATALEDVKQFTHGDRYVPLAGYKTMATHFHNEYIMNEVLKGKPLSEKPEFVDVLKKAGLNIVKLAEFHGPGHPKGPDSSRLTELNALFEQTKKLSDTNFLLLPGEEANNFYGGHWLAFFPKPVYWIMSRNANAPFTTADATYGTVYRVGNTAEMLQLLETENGLAWTAHARTKGSTGYPDKYKNEPFFTSPTFMGAAWKAIPADLSLPTLSKRVLNLLDDMANQGLKKTIIAESDIFTITHQNEMYAHLNVNYLQLDALPDYRDGWAPVLNAMRNGKFFVSTGEVLMPAFSINGKKPGETLHPDASGKALVKLELDWTFPLNFAEIVSGDGHKVYRQRINLHETRAFGKQQFSWPTDMAHKKWVRVEAWDIAANGAFSQMIWVE